MKVLGYQFKPYRAPYRFIRRGLYVVRLSSRDNGKTWSAFVENEDGDVIESFPATANLEFLVTALANERYLD